VVNVAKAMQGKWVWKPKCPVLDHVSRNTSASMTLKRFDYNDALRTSKPSAPILKDWVSDPVDESETKTPQHVHSFVQPTEQVKSPRHSVQHDENSVPPKTAIPKPTSNGKCRNRKACFVGNHKQYAPMTHQNPQRHMVHDAILTKSKPVPITAVRPVSTTVPKTSVTRPKQVKPIVTKPNSPTRRHITRSPSQKASNSPPRVTVVKALVVNVAKAMQGKWDYFKGMSYDDILSIFKAKFDSNVAFLQKIKEQIDEEESRALKRINETPAEKAAKRKMLDKESLVKERFAITKPKNFSDDFLLITLGAMFEKPDIHAQIWKTQ
nr:hypothetical protein [Tanacetum cinerariifolium]